MKFNINKFQKVWAFYLLGWQIVHIIKNTDLLKNNANNIEHIHRRTCIQIVANTCTCIYM